MRKREFAVRTMNAPGLGALVRRLRWWRGLLVLNYHRIGSAAGSPFDWELWSATAEDFDAQVAHVARHFDVIGPDDLEHALSDRTGRFVMLTFDDGYRDNYELAFPILKSHGAVATFFITTGFLDNLDLAWWDEIAWMVRTSQRSHIKANQWIGEDICWDAPDRCNAIRRLLDVYKRLNADDTARYIDLLAEATGSGRAPRVAAADVWMTWEMVREMHRAGMPIGGHTVTHPVLSRLDAVSQGREIGDCKHRIEAELGESITAFSYPDGSRDAFDDRTRSALRQHGFRWAFSYYGGYASPQSDSFNVLRTAIERDTLLPEFRAVTTMPQIFA
ncbi:MAG: polysaccharide deacetylase family protein [Planctomycetaceae bacterium]